MARSDSRFRSTYNAIIQRCANAQPGNALPSENILAQEAGVSRTVVRSVLEEMERAGILVWRGRDKTLLRVPGDVDKLPVRDERTAAQLEGAFLEWILRFDVPAGTPLNMAQLARDFGVSAHILQEFIAGLSRFGLVERRPKGGWVLLGFTVEFAVELSEFRTILETNAVQQVANAPFDHPVWAKLERLRQEHVDLAERIDAAYHDFSRLDEAFHMAINSVVTNRFVVQFQKVISLIFHYHYMWDKRDERLRNQAAIKEHLAIITALLARDEEMAMAAARRHLRTSMTTLLSSLRDHRLG